ncbi:hypothetical protein A2673_01625 [Candidatus Kaiserbacteria bacterium RIFCSPHIGHO2_01_FULL_50_13]|uniref:Dihydrofolate reductase n=1 Tax=Candidatus Kaiserbacteria bacterium RIFCSPLOWO2_01_FULL_50_24 TaxID=1798507 RepID=A0A1F6END9_9BACT|nr:MAG: hypothetical protein A2673_01625 [Candidatus Kaiserbacteria bacterium RIFCSPHIGHO2_01_FULL_50_13]OGG74822.1 MAG: hypothetical protein A3A34_00325 [Candidatus Kaiserbacteria bacterium RIFCSPLOWO2_01_FULL_50_24]OGG81405.1 MAG: hypothetical protein A3H74_03110 [Candidatus Kaiserbacteria bacterium RIFCSPLOWO2_02_FULL_51_13]
MARINIIAALGAGRVIGKDNELLWQIPDDLKRFKRLTLGHPVIMGRKTFESVLHYLGKPLPGRTNIVLSRSLAMFDLVGRTWKNTVVVPSPEEAIEKARELDTDEVFIGGGAQVYEQVLPITDRLYLTLIDDEKEGDTYFPEYEHLFTRVIEDESREWNVLKYRWLTLDR